MTTLKNPDIHCLYPSDMDRLPVPDDPGHRVYNAGRGNPWVVAPKGWRVKRQWQDSRGNYFHELCPYQELGGTNTLADEAVSTE